MKKIKIKLDNDLVVIFNIHLQHALVLHIYNNEI